MYKSVGLIPFKITTTGNSDLNNSTISIDGRWNKQSTNNIEILGNNANLTSLTTGYTYSDFTNHVSRIITSPIWFTRNNTTLLPVKLLLFNLKKVKTTILISWTTTQEINSNYFIVQHSLDGNNWTGITKISAAGSSNSNINYQFTDNAPILGINYYRLMQVDKNEVTTFSTAMNIQFAVNTDVSITPNPTNGFTTISWSQYYNAANKVSVLNTNGTVIKEITTNEQYYKLNTSSFSKGIYYIKVLNGKNLTTQKLLIL